MILQAKFALTLFRSNLCILKRPYKLNLYITDRCNCRCRTCNIWQKVPGRELAKEEWKLFFGRNRYFSWIDVTGGEIFLRNDIEDIFGSIIGLCRGLYLLHFPTNGFLTERVYNTVKYIKRHFKGRLVISISIDGGRKLHNSIRGVEGCWERAVETFRKVESVNKGDTFFGFTLSRYNAGKLEDTFRELAQAIPGLSRNKVHINLAQSSEVYYSNEKDSPVCSKNVLIDEVKRALSKRKFELSPFALMETYFFRRLSQFIENGVYPIKRCGALNSTVSITPAGDVYPCLFFNKKLGSLRDNNFRLKGILSDRSAVMLKKNILKYCPVCWTVCEAYPSILSGLIGRRA